MRRLFGNGDPAARERRRLDAALARLLAAEADRRLDALAGLVAWLRPRRAGEIGSAAQRLRALAERARADAGVRAALRDLLLWLVAEKQPLRLLSDSGILVAEGFFGGVWRRVTHAILPDELDPAQLKDVVSLVFRRRDDHVWVDGIADADWVDLLDALDFGAVVVAGQDRRMPVQILEALQVISYRIAALGLEPELVRNHPPIERYESPFLTQNVELREFIDERRAALAGKREPTIDDKHLLVLLGQCEQIIGKVRKQAAQTGASVSLTVLLARLSQNLVRLKLLLQLLEQRPAHALNELRVRFFKQIVRAENTRHSVRELWRQNVELLAARITENASKTGERYVTSTRAEYGQMLRSALGAGCIVPLMAMIKIALSEDPHPPLVGAVLYSLNYGLGFVLIYLLHFTIATKQPAMTASYLAANLAAAEPSKRVEVAVELIVRTLRSQFIAIVGNVVPAFLLPVAIAYALLANTGAHYLDRGTAQMLLLAQHPFESLAWFHAAIAGVCLFLAGLISGYFDNKAVYNRVPQRIEQLRWLRRLLGAARTQRFAAYVENNLGALAGNFFFGCMLGSVGTLGFILGLPIDIRHITFSASYFGYAMVGVDWEVSTRVAVTVAVGVLGIGLINLLVSFGLALFVAMRAQRAYFGKGRVLLAALGWRFLRGPRDFFWPPRERTERGEAPARTP